MTTLFVASIALLNCLLRSSDVRASPRTLPKLVRVLYKTKLHHWRRWRSFRSPKDLAEYRIVSQRCCHLTRERRRRFEITLASSYNIRRFYRFVNSKLFERNTLTHLMDDDGRLMTDPYAVAQLFNSYFASVFTVDDATIPNFASRTSNTISDIQFSPSTVYTAFRLLKTSTSVGPDAIPNLVLRRCAGTLSAPLAHIFGISFKDSVLPASWKTAIVHPVLKKSPSTCPATYRPLSMTPSCCRAMETVINL